MKTPPLIPALESLASQGRTDIARLLQEAYKVGRDDMRRELMALLSPLAASMSLSGSVPSVTVSSSAKAPPGTVKPAILAMIENSHGLLTGQVIAQTGFKENSVRGTLAALLKEGKIERNGGYWVKKAEAPSGEPGEAS